MWIFTRDGFLSVVAHRDNPDYRLVRGREGDDIKRAFPHAIVLESAEGDYRFRAKVHWSAVADYLIDQAKGIDYDTNVKGNLDRDEPDRKRFLGDVWEAGFWFQDQREHPEVGPDRRSWSRPDIKRRLRWTAKGAS